MSRSMVAYMRGGLVIVGAAFAFALLRGRSRYRAHRPHQQSLAFVAGRPPTIAAEELRKQLYASDGLWTTDLHVVVKCGHGDPQFTLAYMPMRNRCELPRLILEEAKCPYELEIIGFKVWPALKEKFPHGKVPVLYNFDGKGNHLCQETAITQYLAHRVGLAGKTPEEQALVNMLYQFFWSTFRNNGVTHDGEFYSAVKLKDVHLTSWPRYQEMHRVNNFSVAERSLAALGVFEERLEASGTGFLVGSSLTYIDLALFYNLFELAEEDRVPDFATRFNFPRLGAFLEAMENRPQLRDYLQSPRRIPRYSRPDGPPGSQARMESGYIYYPGKYSPRPEGT